MSVVQVAGAPLVTFDAVEPFRTQACLAVLTGKACFAKARATHVIAFPSIDTLAGLSTASSVGTHRTLVLAPAQQKAEAEERVGSTLGKQSIQTILRTN